MSTPGKSDSASRKPKFPWIAFLLLVLALYLFWGLPAQLGPRKIQVEYKPAPTK